MIINKYKKHKRQYEKDQMIIKPFAKFYRHSFQDIEIDKNKFESLCNSFTKSLGETKNESFL